MSGGEVLRVGQVVGMELHHHVSKVNWICFEYLKKNLPTYYRSHERFACAFFLLLKSTLFFSFRNQPLE